MEDKSKRNFKTYRVHSDTKDVILGLKAYYQADENISLTQNQIIELSIKQWYKTFKKKVETF